MRDLFSHVAEVELIYRNKVKNDERPRVKNSQDAYALLLHTWDLNKIELQEQFKIILLDSKKACLGISTVATGGIASCMVDLKIAFATALKARATSMILAHNHPSGNILASESDKSLTSRFAEAGYILDLNIQDHIIVTKEGYTSFADEGMMPRIPF